MAVRLVAKKLPAMLRVSQTYTNLAGSTKRQCPNTPAIFLSRTVYEVDSTLDSAALSSAATLKATAGESQTASLFKQSPFTAQSQSRPPRQQQRSAELGSAADAAAQ